MQTPEEFAEDFREWMVANAQWPMLGDANATRKLEQIIRARDAEIRRECAEKTFQAITEYWDKHRYSRTLIGCLNAIRAAIIGEEE